MGVSAFCVGFVQTVYADMCTYVAQFQLSTADTRGPSYTCRICNSSLHNCMNLLLHQSEAEKH